MIAMAQHIYNTYCSHLFSYDTAVLSLICNTAWQVKELTGGKGANVIMEAVGGQVFTECLKW